MKRKLNGVFICLDSLMFSWNVIWLLTLLALVFINISLFFKSNDIWLDVLIAFCCVSSIVIFPYMKLKLLPSIMKPTDYDITTHSLTTFFLIIVGIIPLELLFITDMNLRLISDFGLLTVIQLCGVGGAMLAISTFLMVSIIYWMFLIEIRKESILFIKCKKLKQEIYE